jgi:type II secretory pathway predicted ATPase ExeA
MFTDHFRLSAEPFGITPDPSYVYLGPEHREALAALQYGLLERRGFITLIGEVGTGKTTLLYTLLSNLGPEVRAAYVAYTAQPFVDLLAAALRDFGVTPAGMSKRELLDALNAFLLEQEERGATTALLIDEAQNVSDETFEELRLLSNFETYERKLLQIVLVGQPELWDRLSQPHLRQLRERVTVRPRIDPLSRREVRRYLEHRLQRVGATSCTLFSPCALRVIVARSRGIPRRINNLCHNALLFAYGRGVRRVTARMARDVQSEMNERRSAGWSVSVVWRVLARRTAARWVGATAALAIAAAVWLPRVSYDAAAPGSAAVPAVGEPVDVSLDGRGLAPVESGTDLRLPWPHERDVAARARIADHDLESFAWRTTGGAASHSVGVAPRGDSRDGTAKVAGRPVRVPRNPGTVETTRSAAAIRVAATTVARTADVAAARISATHGAETGIRGGGMLQTGAAATDEREAEPRPVPEGAVAIMHPPMTAPASSPGTGIHAAAERRSATPTQPGPGQRVRRVEATSASREAPEHARADEVVVKRVSPGATVYSIGREVYAARGERFDAQEFLSAVRRFNPSLGDLDRIAAGQAIRLPASLVIARASVGSGLGE